MQTRLPAASAAASALELFHCRRNSDAAGSRVYLTTFPETLLQGICSTTPATVAEEERQRRPRRGGGAVRGRFDAHEAGRAQSLDGSLQFLCADGRRRDPGGSG